MTLKISPSASTSIGMRVELRQIERFDAEPLERAGEAVLDVLAGELVGEHRAVAAELGRDENALLVLEGADAALRLAAAIDVGGVPEVDVERPRRSSGCRPRLVADRAETLAELPGAEPDFGDLVAGLAEGAAVHHDLSFVARNLIFGQSRCVRPSHHSLCAR